MSKEELLQEENDQLKQELEILRKAVQAGIWILHFDENGRNTDCIWGENFRRLLGYNSKDEFPTERFSLVNAIHPDDREMAEGALMSVIYDRTDKLTYDMEFRVMTRDKGYQWFHSVGRVARREDGSPKTMYGLFTNIDEKKRRELQIRQQMRVIETLSKDYASVWLLQPTQNLILYRQENQRGTKNVIGTIEQSDNNLTRSLSAYAQGYLKPEDRPAFVEALRYENIYEQVKQNGVFSYSYIRCFEGVEEHFLLTFTRTHDFDFSRDIVISFKNIEALYQKEYERSRALEASRAELQVALREKEEHVKEVTELNNELADAKRAAEAANQSKTIFLNNMSHDIRTPMNAILGFAELMEKQKDNPAIISDYLAKIKDSGQYLITIINNVLDMARIESGKTVVTPEFLDLPALIGTALPMFEDLARKKSLHLAFEEDIQHRYVMQDKTKLQEIVTNLVSNAVKYTPEDGEVVVSLTECPSQRDGFGTYVIKVKDTGIGMSPEFAEHIFENFTRERSTTESKVIGTGLGMSIVKKLVELLGGTIGMETELGKGTTFTVTLQQKIVSDPTPYLKSEGKAMCNKEMLRGKRVLLTEDNELNAEIVTAILEDLGVSTERAENGQRCLQMLQDAAPRHYDAILMDIQMPILNGYDAARRIRQMDDTEKATIPIVALTANAFDEDRQKAIDAGMNTHLAKPINVEQLVEVLCQLTV